MTRMECDFCGREIKNGEVWYHCEQDSKCYGTDWNAPVEDVDPETGELPGQKEWTA